MMDWSIIFDEHNIQYRNDINYKNNKSNKKEKITKEHTHSINENKYYDIEDISIINKLNQIIEDTSFNSYNVLQNLEKSKFITEYLSNYISYYHFLYEKNKLNRNNVVNEKININKLKKIVKWLLEFNTFYIKKLHLVTINLKRNDMDFNFIPRLRYDFCKYGSSCNFNYNKKKHRCKEDHYVYNKLYTDIFIIFQYINKYEDEIVKHNDILKNFKTINFVMTHMYEEFYQIAQYIETQEYDKFHVNN